MLKLKSAERSSLFKKAHHLKPVVIIGRAGLTPEVLNAIEKALEDHELIKVKFLELKEEKRETSDQIAVRLKACIIRVIGNIAIFYKKNKLKEKNKKLPFLK